MIYPLGGLLIGAILGWFQAGKRGGTTKDRAQWAAVLAMILGIIGLFVMIFIDRSYR